MASEPLLSVVIPVYRAQGHLRATVHELLEQLGPRYALEILLVNDGSPDDVQQVIVELASHDQRVRFLELGRNGGQHAATLLGFTATRGKWVVTVDDDGQNPPAAVEAVLEALRGEDLDVVYGRFESTEQRTGRIFASRANRLLSALTLGNTGQVAVSNVRALRGDLARWIGRAAPQHPYIDALIFRATRRIGQVSVPHRPRAGGRSTYTLAKLLSLWVSHLTTLTALPIQVAGWGSFGVAAVATLVGTVQLIRVLVEQRAPAGWLSLFCAVTFLFAVLFAFLGVIGTYLARMYVAQNAQGLDWVRSRSDGETPR